MPTWFEFKKLVERLEETPDVIAYRAAKANMKAMWELEKGEVQKVSDVMNEYFASESMRRSVQEGSNRS